MNNIILFDGVCNLCNGSVRAIIKLDKKEVFKFASLQSSIGKAILKKYNFNTLNSNSIVVIANNNAFNKSTAILIIIKQLGGIWQLLYVFVLIPKPIRDTIYNVIAKHRYNLFGKRENCIIPNKKIKSRFL